MYTWANKTSQLPEFSVEIIGASHSNYYNGNACKCQCLKSNKIVTVIDQLQ